jgi:hypothetical protein
MNIREQIALKIGINFSELLLKDINEESDRLADEILALPSGLVAVRECACNDKGYDSKKGTMDKCQYCSGAGRIERDIPISEALELFKSKMNKTIMWVTPSGERVEVKGGA